VNFERGKIILDDTLFNCEQCGVCCKNVTVFEEMKEFDRGDGVCKYLNNKNMCDIYKTRPNICNSEYIYKTYFNHLTKEDFFKETKQLCIKIRENINK